MIERIIGSGGIYYVNENETIVIASAQGVKGALDLSVTFNNGESTAAELIGIDELTDLAVLRTKPSFSTAPILLGSISTLSLGEWVIAVGNNKRDDFAPAISVGVISALAGLVLAANMLKMPIAGPVAAFVIAVIIAKYIVMRFRVYFGISFFYFM